MQCGRTSGAACRLAVRRMGQQLTLIRNGIGPAAGAAVARRALAKLGYAGWPRAGAGARGRRCDRDVATWVGRRRCQPEGYVRDCATAAWLAGCRSWPVIETGLHTMDTLGPARSVSAIVTAPDASWRRAIREIGRTNDCILYAPRRYPCSDDEAGGAAERAFVDVARYARPSTTLQALRQRLYKIDPMLSPSEVGSPASSADAIPWRPVKPQLLARARASRERVHVSGTGPSLLFPRLALFSLTMPRALYRVDLVCRTGAFHRCPPVVTSLSNVERMDDDAVAGRSPAQDRSV